MANFNRVLLMGNLTRDPELRYTPSGSAVCGFGLAVNRRYKTSDGEQQQETCFVEVSAFARQAETISQYLNKGSPIFIEGRLKLDQWTSQDGQKRSRLSVVAERFQFLGRGREAQGGPEEGSAERPRDRDSEASEDGIPF